MKAKITIGARIGLGLIFFVVGGLNGFLQFLPMPTPPPEAGAFLGALMETGYFFPMLTGIELVMGAFLLAGVFIPLALTVLAPIVVNMVMYHLFLDPVGIVVPLVALALGIYLAYSYRDVYKSVLVRKVVPTFSETKAPLQPANSVV